MKTSKTDKRAPPKSIIGTGALVSSSGVSALRISVPSRYYFNLTDGDTMIRDEEGIEASSIQAAVISAMEAVEELRAQDPSNSDEWQGWRLEIVDASGHAVQTIPLDALSAH
jgi:hypothetical protein